MKRENPIIFFTFLVLAFGIPFLLFFFTKSHSLMFDDSAEFALVTWLRSIAHPPGTPAYVLLGMVWSQLMALFGMNHVDAITLFASICVSFASVLLYLCFNKISFRLCGKIGMKQIIVSFCCAVAYATAATTWAWANTVEVYSLQVFAMALALYGLISFNLSESRIFIWTAAAGISIGLANHHLTMICFLPFTLFFFLPDLITGKKPSHSKLKAAKKEKHTKGPGIAGQLAGVFRKSDFLLLTGLTAVATLLFYGWMFFRAQEDYPFMFGGPKTLSELYYHISGGSYAKNISSTSGAIISSRIPFFLKLTGMQLLLLLPFCIAGLAYMMRKGYGRLAWIILTYFFILFIYQINNNQWSSTDAYMLLPFMLLYIPVIYGSVIYLEKIKAHLMLPLLLVIQVILNYPANDKKTYPVSADLMKLLDVSSPPNSVLIISDWSTIIQYYYYRIVENFRPDLVVLHYDFKFTHYRILPVLYPEYYEKIKNEYDHFISQLAKQHPHQIVNTGCDLDTPELSRSFQVLLAKMEALAKSENRNFLTDPKSHYFFSTQKFYSSQRYVSGCFSSAQPGDTVSNDNFLKLDLKFLNSPLLLHDPSALDKLVDFQAMLDQHIAYYKSNNDKERLSKAENQRDYIMRLQRKMKESMSFAYKL